MVLIADLERLDVFLAHRSQNTGECYNILMRKVLLVPHSLGYKKVSVIFSVVNQNVLLINKVNVITTQLGSVYSSLRSFDFN